MTCFWTHIGLRARPIAFVLAIAAAWSSSGISDVSAQKADVYTVAKVKTDATAKDAVSAKRQALASAGERALRTLFKRVAPYTAYDRLPAVKTALIDDMLENFSVRRERNSATQYLATLDYRFNADAVRQFLSGYNIPHSDVQAARIIVLPVFIKGDKVIASGSDPWRKAWAQLDLQHAITPVRLVSTGPSLTADVLAAILAGDADRFGALKTRYKTETLVLAVARAAPGTGRVEIKLYGIDAVGPLALARTDRIYGTDLDAGVRRAALVSLRILEERWKITQTDPEAAGGDAAQQPVIMTVEFASLKQWQQIRARLARIPGVQAMEISSLSARSADITFRYPGGAQRLGPKLSAHNMVMSNIGGDWILRSN